MRRKIVSLAFCFLPVSAFAESISVQVKGMVCAFCAQGIEKKFKAQSEINKVNVSLESKIVSLETKAGKTLNDELIKKIITEAGYDVLKIERAK